MSGQKRAIGGKEELLPHELQSSQAQATQPDLILQFCEQGFYLLSLPLGVGELEGNLGTDGTFNDCLSDFAS